MDVKAVFLFLNTGIKSIILNTFKNCIYIKKTTEIDIFLFSTVVYSLNY